MADEELAVTKPHQIAPEPRSGAARHGAAFVSVVIPHFNDFDNLALCLASLRAQSLSSDRYEIVVADNNSVDGVERVQRLAPDIRVVPALEQGAGPARNAGAAAAQGEIVAFIDSDCIAHPNWLSAGIEALRRYDYAGGQVVVFPRTADRMTAAEAYELVFAFNFKKYIEKDKYSGSGNLFMTRRVFDQVGGFRAGVSEDVDWCRRANRLGLRLGYAPDAIVRHAARHSWNDLTRKWNRVIGEDLASMRERPGWRWRWYAWAIAVAASPLAHALRVMRSDRLPGPRDKLMGLIGLVGIREYRAWRMVRHATT